MKTIKQIALLILVLSIIIPAYASGQSFLVRINTSVGYSNSKELSWLSYSYGVKVGLGVNDKQRFGIMFDRLILAENTDNRTMYYTTGIFLEQVLWKYFNMGIGTVGYINQTEKGKNTFGIYSHLGFEYPFAKRWHFLASYQSNFIFEKKMISNSGLSLGVGMKF
ncbi:MAG: outer membrane beta-barrel protein [Tannerellaceae bacterium]|nr:outer membrane beta-barrel protein [Tannerellaceae bacterium]